MKRLRALVAGCIGLVGVWSLGPVSAATLANSTSAGCSISPGIPAPPANAKTLSPGTGGDDTARIQQAVDQLRPSDWLVFQPGTYQISKHISIGGSGIVLYGAGATIHGTSSTDSALMIQGDNVAVFAFTTTQESVSRLATPWAGGISVYDDRSGAGRRVSGSLIQGNTVNSSAAAGIILYKASGFTIAGNTVYRSWADGIHLTGGSSDGRVIQNVVRQSGDDMIAVVSYAGAQGSDPATDTSAAWARQQDELDRDIYIGKNDVSDQYWGRGVSVVGGNDVTIEGNSISKTATGAGIYLTRERAYVTFGDHNILVLNNQISQVQTLAPGYMPAGFNPVQTHQGGIEIGAQMLDDEAANPIYRAAFSVSNVALIGNQISNARFDGIRIGIFSPANSVGQLTIGGNVMNAVASANVIEAFPGFMASTGACNNNMLNGSNWGALCDKAVPAVALAIPVTGSSLQCDASGHIIPSGIRPQPPSQFRVK